MDPIHLLGGVHAVVLRLAEGLLPPPCRPAPLHAALHQFLSAMEAGKWWIREGCQANQGGVPIRQERGTPRGADQRGGGGRQAAGAARGKTAIEPQFLFFFELEVKIGYYWRWIFLLSPHIYLGSYQTINLGENIGNSWRCSKTL